MTHRGSQLNGGRHLIVGHESRVALELAEQRGFAAGIELNDWLQAEKDIDSDDKQAAPADPEDAATRCVREISGYSGDRGNVK
jgi:hypothetical protein